MLQNGLFTEVAEINHRLTLCPDGFKFPSPEDDMQINFIEGPFFEAFFHVGMGIGVNFFKPG